MVTFTNPSVPDRASAVGISTVVAFRGSSQCCDVCSWPLRRCARFGQRMLSRRVLFSRELEFGGLGAMKAAQVSELAGPTAVSVVEVDSPTPGPEQVLVEVHAAGVSFPDLLMTKGEYQLQPEVPFIPGCEVAGVVVDANGVQGYQAGDRIAAFTMLGGFAEQAVVDPAWAVRLPNALSYAHGAALPMNYLTMEFGLFRRGNVQAGETVLVQGAAGGIGTASIQLAKAAGATVIAVVSTEEKREIAMTAGADHAVAVDEFRVAAKDLTGGRGVDVVVDPVGGDRFTDSLRCLKSEGRLLVVGFTGGEIPSVKVNRLLLNNISVVGVAWGAFAFVNPGYIQSQWKTIIELFRTNCINPPIGEKYALADAGEAVGALENRTALGKIVILPDR